MSFLAVNVLIILHFGFLFFYKRESGFNGQTILKTEVKTESYYLDFRYAGI